MKRLVRSGLLSVASAGLLLAASEAKATTETFTATHSPSTTEWSDNFILQEFNPALGSLQSVYILASQSVSINGTVNNTATVSESFTFRAGSQLTVTLPGVLGFLQPSPLASAQAFNLPSGATAPYGPVNGSDSVNYTYTLPADMANFIGAGTLTLPGSTLSQELISGGGGNITASLTTVSGATVEVQYTYLPVPEPGSLALLALGGAVMLLRRRR